MGAVVAVALVAGCSSSNDDDAGAVADDTVDELADVVADADSAADTGCVDEAGELAATAAAWYPEAAQGILQQGGDDVQAPSAEHGAAFAELADAAVSSTLPDAVAGDLSELDASGTGCTTHRRVIFEVGRAQVAVVEFRSVHAASPRWIANETGFEATDDGTMVSAGTSLRVALAVAPDGTTVRVTAFGPGALDQYTGWPTTFPQEPDAPASGPAPADSEMIVAIAHEVLAGVLADR